LSGAVDLAFVLAFSVAFVFVRSVILSFETRESDSPWLFALQAP
jgi:hypothetical protein